MQVLICDSDKEFAYRIIKEMSSKGQDVFEFHYVSDGNSFLDFVMRNNNPYLIFMDVVSGASERASNGIELIIKSNPFIRKSLIVFLSENSEYVTDVYETPHLAFILKKDMKARCSWLLGKIKKLKEQKSLLFLEAGKKKTMIPTEQILFLERERRSTYIYTTDGIFRSASKLSELQEQLDEKMFVRCHNSYIVNLDYVMIYHRTEFIFNEDKKIPISRSHQKDMKQILDNWMRERKIM
ncbi:MAG: LytTR family DNA-binding domain-containing protein [Lachnospiraceae bacterium]|nr:LytTR family DNA-binding domain-containing protein [Lachnospiraceae bacterium]